jgi:hypothetical protein
MSRSAHTNNQFDQPNFVCLLFLKRVLLRGKSFQLKSKYNKKKCQYHDTISVELGVSGVFEVLKLKTCSLYHEKLLLQKFNDMITQVIK